MADLRYGDEEWEAMLDELAPLPGEALEARAAIYERLLAVCAEKPPEGKLIKFPGADA